MSHETFMHHALELAEKAFAQGEIPVGAILVSGDRVVAESFNTRNADGNPLHHAEILVLQAAAQNRGDWRLSDCDLYVTLEPCPMCLGALLQARVRQLVFGAFDTKRKPDDFFPSLEHCMDAAGGCGEISANNHKLKIVGGVLQNESAALLKNFFQKKR